MEELVISSYSSYTNHHLWHGDLRPQCPRQSGKQDSFRRLQMHLKLGSVVEIGPCVPSTACHILDISLGDLSSRQASLLRGAVAVDE
mmetsp:Transcript_1249/g.2018  ORF Transcript_1249/g.2018 Transcript_1249/m.2018 type:complete len:87 (-) Transcript_1249:82-342(-)